MQELQNQSSESYKYSMSFDGLEMSSDLVAFLKQHASSTAQLYKRIQIVEKDCSSCRSSRGQASVIVVVVVVVVVVVLVQVVLTLVV